jgi:hypothetical protein
MTPDPPAGPPGSSRPFRMLHDTHPVRGGLIRQKASRWLPPIFQGDRKMPGTSTPAAPGRADPATMGVPVVRLSASGLPGEEEP